MGVENEAVETIIEEGHSVLAVSAEAGDVAEEQATVHEEYSHRVVGVDETTVLTR